MTAPKLLAVTSCNSNGACPAVYALPDGSLAVVGPDATEGTAVPYGPGERVVHVSAQLLLAAVAKVEAE